MEQLMNIFTRIQHKIDTQENWESIGETFCPLNGELIIYSDINKIKIGDGSTSLNSLSYSYFVDEQTMIDELKTYIDETLLNAEW